MSFKYVKIHYGPVLTFNLCLLHKPQYVYGLRDYLRRLGFRVDIIPVSYNNYCVLEMCGYIVFKCNIKNLKFNMPYEYDQTCKNAVEAVLEANEKLVRSRSYLWLWERIESETILRSEYIPKGIWLPKTAPIEDVEDLLACADCCGLGADRRDRRASEERRLKRKEALYFDSIKKTFNKALSVENFKSLTHFSDDDDDWGA